MKQATTKAATAKPRRRAAAKSSTATPDLRDLRPPISVCETTTQQVFYPGHGWIEWGVVRRFVRQVESLDELAKPLSDGGKRFTHKLTRRVEVAKAREARTSQVEERDGKIAEFASRYEDLALTAQQLRRKLVYDKAERERVFGKDAKAEAVPSLRTIQRAIKDKRDT